MSEKLRKRVKRLLEVLELNPWPAKLYDLEKLEGVDFDGYRVRLGRLRVIYAVLEDERRIFVLKIEHRKKVYRGL